MIAFDLQTAPVSPPPPAQSRSEDGSTFTAVDPNAEHYNGSTLMVEAYAAIWVILMAWIFLLWRKGVGLAERLDDLERTIDRAAARDMRAEKKAKATAS